MRSLFVFPLVVLAVSLLPCSLTGCGEGAAERISTTGDRAPSSGTPDPEPAPDPGDDLAVHKEVLRLTNEFRVANGRAPLEWNGQLYVAAQKHAQAMATLGFFSHTSPDGSSAGDRISDEGYDWSTWGENIAYGYKTAQAVVQAWINSPGHRANMLSSNFRELGVGYSVKSSGTAYWVQDFGRQ